MAGGLAVIPLAVFLAGDARADPAAEADLLFQEATHLLQAGQFAQACPKLARSQTLDPALGTLLYLAACHEKLGLTASAWSEFSSATEWATRTHQPDRAAFGRKHMAQLESTLARVVIRASQAPPGFELWVDDGAHGSVAAGNPVPLDPGTHTLEGTAPGYRPWRRMVTVPARATTLTVDVPVLESSAPVNAPPPAIESGPPPESATPGASPPSSSHVFVWSAAGLGAAGILAGSVFGVMTFAARGSARSACPENACAPGGLEDVDRLRTYSAVSTVAFGVGLAGALAAGYLFLRERGQGSADGTAPKGVAGSATLVPSVSTRQAAIAVLAHF